MKRQAVALVEESRCIGCTRCIEVCPVDAIVGAQGLMHTVVEKMTELEMAAVAEYVSSK